MIEFVWPLAFILLPLPLLVRKFTTPLPQHDAALLVPSVDAFRTNADPELAKKGLGFGVVLLLWLAWALLVVALARPQYVGDPVSLPTSGRDLMLAVDISGSMSTEDMKVTDSYVSRLTVVKSVVRDFIERRQGDRIGLILFGTNAYVQAPLTFDLPTVNQLLIEAPVGIAGGKTAIGDAIGLAVKRLRERPAESRVVILLTDGSNNVGEVSPRKAAELAEDLGVRIHTIGVGADEMELSSFFGFGRRKVNPSADLDEETLNDIAETTGGQYFRATDTARLIEVYDEISGLEPVEQDPETYRPIRSLFFWPLAASLALFLAILGLDAIAPRLRGKLAGAA